MSYNNARISYLRFGTGPKRAFCFHGYGEEAATFAFLEKHAGDQFTFIAIDLPFHGQTEWPDGQAFFQLDLEKIVSEIIQQQDLFPDHKVKLTLIGFSLGGRLALSLYGSVPAIGERLVLLAPDGLKINFWYWLATQTAPGKKLFYYTMKKPGWFFAFLKVMNKLRLVNSSIFKFVNYYIGDPVARRLLYERWTSLRYIKPQLDRIKSNIAVHRTPVRLVYGKHDRIILPVRGEKFRKKIEEYCQLSVIHSGHQVLHEKHVSEILPALLQ